VLGEGRGDPPGHGVAGGGEQHTLRVGVPHPLDHPIPTARGVWTVGRKAPRAPRTLNSSGSWTAHRCGETSELGHRLCPVGRPSFYLLDGTNGNDPALNMYPFIFFLEEFKST
jgi:hypothetical protein